MGAGVRRLAVMLLVVGAAVVAVTVLVFRSVAGPDPAPSLGPVVQVSSHQGGGDTPRPTRPSAAGGDGDDGGASAVMPRTPEEAGGEEAGGDGSDDMDADHDDAHDD